MRFFSDLVASPARQGGYTCDKLKATQIANFKRPGHYKQTVFGHVASPGKKLQGGYTGNYLCDFVAKVSTLATFFLRIFHLSRRQFKGGYTCDFHLEVATRQSLEKLHHQCEQMIARVAAA